MLHIPGPIKPAGVARLSGGARTARQGLNRARNTYATPAPALPAPPTSHPLPVLALELARAAADLTVPESELDRLYRNVKVARLADQSHVTPALAVKRELSQAGQPAPITDQEIRSRKEQLLRTIADKLSEQGDCVPMNMITADPVIVSLRKGVVANLAKFLWEFPQHFEVSAAPSPQEGKGSVQVVRLLAPLPDVAGALFPSKRKRHHIPEEERREALLYQIASTLSENSGIMTVSNLGLDPAVRSALVGVNTKLKKFMSTFPEVFSLTDDPQGVQTCELLVPPESAVEKANVREKMASKVARTDEFGASTEQLEVEERTQSLLNEIHRIALENGGQIRYLTLNSIPEIIAMKKGVARDLKKFLARHDDWFELERLEDLDGCTVNIKNFWY